MNSFAFVLLLIIMPLSQSITTKPSEIMQNQKFIEITVQNHLISHGFDENNKEIIEEVTVDKPMKKLLAIDRIQSISEKYVLTTYAHGRLVYWEYLGSYEELKSLLNR